MHDVNGNIIEIGTRFLISDTVKFVLPVGELGRHGWSTTLGPRPWSKHEAGCQVPLTRKANTFLLVCSLVILRRIPLPPQFRAVIWRVRRLHHLDWIGLDWIELPAASTWSASGTPGRCFLRSQKRSQHQSEWTWYWQNVPLRPVLSASSPVAALSDKLMAPSGPIYGTKDKLWKTSRTMY